MEKTTTESVSNSNSTAYFMDFKQNFSNTRLYAEIEKLFSERICGEMGTQDCIRHCGSGNNERQRILSHLCMNKARFQSLITPRKEVLHGRLNGSYLEKLFGLGNDCECVSHMSKSNDEEALLSFLELGIPV